MATLTVKQFDTYPTWKMALSDANGPIDLTNAASVKLAGKGNASAIAIGGAATIAQTNITATTVASSATITSVVVTSGSGANIASGQPITGGSIPAGTVVESYNSGAGTILMSAQANAPASAVPIIVNEGGIVYAPTTTDTGTVDLFPVEAAIHWSVGVVQKVPNAQSANPTIEIDGDLGGSAE